MSLSEILSHVSLHLAPMFIKFILSGFMLSTMQCKFAQTILPLVSHGLMYVRKSSLLLVDLSLVFHQLPSNFNCRIMLTFIHMVTMAILVESIDSTPTSVARQ